MDIFKKCHEINDLLLSGNENAARNSLIVLLDQIRLVGQNYTGVINRLIREVGLFPYLQPETAAWQERFVYDVFKSDIGGEEPVTLHREQSRLLNKLLDGKSIAVSAPTSFGKSFVIDSFISIKQPKVVVILVPTIALADETRRRLHKKFSGKYKIVTTSEQIVSENCILILPQERVVGYIQILSRIDMLIVDEFYKASQEFDKERAPALIRAIVELSKVARQRYFLAPNISDFNGNSFTDGMEFVRLDFNTVYLDVKELYRDIGRDIEKKNSALLQILKDQHGKMLIYAGSYSNIESIATLLMRSMKSLPRKVLRSFRAWLSKNYEPNWMLPVLVDCGVGVHNGRLHRSLSQIQIRLFEDREGLDRIVSTSSIIEGVNTSAEVVVLWSNKNGRARINDFTYKNIIGRGGRMFKHFVGRIFVLEEPPRETQTHLELVLPNELLGTMDESQFKIDLTADQVAAIERYRSELGRLVGSDALSELQAPGLLQNSNSTFILRLAGELHRDLGSWNGIGHLNSNDPDKWDHYLYKLINLHPGAWGIEYSKYVSFVKILSRNWELSIPELLSELSSYDVSIDQFFELERNTTFRLASTLGDVQTIYNKINRAAPVDLSAAISRLSHAFLPVSVYQLEEYGLPRMISRKIQRAGVVNFEREALSVDQVIEELSSIGLSGVLDKVQDVDDFDEYILEYFYEGIARQGSSPVRERQHNDPK